MERVCKNCGRQLLGRADQKYCTDQCRIDYYNRLNSKENNMIRRIDGILRRNRRIMESLCSNGIFKIHKTRLVELGFDFSYFTGTHKSNEGNIFYTCYDHSYSQMKENIYRLEEPEREREI